MYATTSRYRGASADERRALRRRALLDAALDLVAQDGPTGITMRGVASRARLNERYFYESFTSCDQLAEELFDDQVTSIVEIVNTAIAASPNDSYIRLRAVVSAMVAFIDDDPRKGRVLFLESQATEGLRSRRAAFVQRLVDLMHAQARELLGDEAVATTYATLAMLTAANGAIDLLAYWLRGDLDQAVDRDTLIEFLVSTLQSVVEDVTTPPARH